MKILIAVFLLSPACLPAAAQGDASRPGAENTVQTDPGPGGGDAGKDAETSRGWFPGTRLFHALMADPRRTAFSAALRYDDDAFERYDKSPTGEKTGVLGKERVFASVTAGGRFPVYRWKLSRGCLQAGIEGSVQALFAIKSRETTASGDMSTMLNADYFVAIPVEYAWEGLAVQFRFYHLSTHAGDELMALYPVFERINLSFEAVDLFVSYYIVPQARVYFGIGCVMHYAQEGVFDPVTIDYGAEFRPFARMRAGAGLFWQPFAAAHFRNLQYNSWSFDGRYSLGVEFTPARRLLNTRFQLALGFYHGRSYEGQFYHQRTSFVDLGFSFEL